MVAEEIKKSRLYQHETRKIKGHRSTKYKDLQRFKTQRTQTQTQPSISSKPSTSHEKSNPSYKYQTQKQTHKFQTQKKFKKLTHKFKKPRNKPTNFKPIKSEKLTHEPKNPETNPQISIAISATNLPPISTTELDSTTYLHRNLYHRGERLRAERERPNPPIWERDPPI